MEQKRKNYLKKELEALGYKVKISRDDGPIPEELGYVVSIGKEKQSGSMYRSYIEIQGNGLEKEEL